MRAIAAPNPRIGYLFMVIAAVLFSLMSVQVKLASRLLPVSMLISARIVISLVISYTTLRARGIPAWGKNRRVLFARGFFGTLALCCFFFAITTLPLAEVTVIHYLNPIITAALAYKLLGEGLGIRLLIALLVATVGVVLVARPTFLGFGTVDGGLNPLGVGAALCGAALSAGAYISVRHLRRTEHPDVIIFYFPVVALPVIVPLLWWRVIWPTTAGWLWMFSIGLTTQLAQVFLTRGLARVPAGKGMTVGTLQVVMATIWGLVIFNHVPPALALLGGVMILCGTALVLTEKPIQATSSQATSS